MKGAEVGCAVVQTVQPLEVGKAPLGIVKRTEEEFADWVATEAGFLGAFASFDGEPLKVEPYQLRFLQSTASYRCVEKSRQVGYSFVFACEGTARAHMRDGYTGVFVSYNLADAKEKILYCQQLHEELPLSYQKKKVVDSKLEIAFASNGAKGRVSRIISNPSKAPRGKKGDIYLDELAHCANDRDIYTGSTALILRSRGQLTVCSSPLGKRGVFWEIARQEVKPYRSYWRQIIPWWLCGFMCKDIVAASAKAPKMTTVERVARFGTKQIQEQFEALLLEDFQQEFEVAYSDETLSFFPYELILPCTQDYELCEEIAEIFNVAKGRLTLGYDVGRKRDASAMAIFEELTDGTLKLRFLKEYERTPFAAQEAEIRTALTILPIARASIDNNGIGMQLAENLVNEFPDKVIAEDMTLPLKEMLCVDLKIGLQKHMIDLPADRELVGQIHSIKKSVTPAGRVTFDAERNSKGHADKFWAVALAAKKERGLMNSNAPSVSVQVFG